jgi:small GTP-binding protein
MSVYNYKVVLVGRSGVGKSSVAMRIVRDTFTPDQEATIGAAFLTKQIKTDPGYTPSTIQLQIWDTAGQERYHSLVPMYTRGSHIILLCIDSPAQIGLQHDIKTFNVDNIDATIFIVVTKSDLINKRDYDELQKFCVDQMYPVYYVSSKTRAGVDDLVEAMNLVCMRKKPMDSKLPKLIQYKDKEETPCCAT